MARDAIERVAAQVSVRNYSGDSHISVGVRARSRLGIGYNDKVAIVFPEVGEHGTDIRKTGHLNSADRVSVPSALAEEIKETNAPSERVTAYVEKLEGSWEAEHDLGEQRWDNNSNTLDTFE